MELKLLVSCLQLPAQPMYTWTRKPIHIRTYSPLTIILMNHGTWPHLSPLFWVHNGPYLAIWLAQFWTQLEPNLGHKIEPVWVSFGPGFGSNRCPTFGLQMLLLCAYLEPVLDSDLILLWFPFASNF